MTLGTWAPPLPLFTPCRVCSFSKKTPLLIKLMNWELLHTILRYRGYHSSVPGWGGGVTVNGHRRKGELALLCHRDLQFVLRHPVSFFFLPFILPAISPAGTLQGFLGYSILCLKFGLRLLLLQTLVTSSPSAFCPTETCWNLSSDNNLLLLCYYGIMHFYPLWSI